MQQSWLQQGRQLSTVLQASHLHSRCSSLQVAAAVQVPQQAALAHPVRPLPYHAAQGGQSHAQRDSFPQGVQNCSRIQVGAWSTTTSVR